ncbi:uncharacterized protein LOC129920251 [Episyrphus balteatus]|uniref:uncharacterized protein LOC129920251 n=1 Tax=Episyrphus balteatus TaxID=286459 RepID=UPI002484E040|nr:uncharacterized protein LOC129920251 [Episyrphus balteatus]
MLNIPRLRDVLKKLETTSDLARNLIKRASVVIDGNNNNNTITINKEHGTMISSSSFADKPPDVTSSVTTSSSTLASQFNTLTKIATPGTNEIKMMMYNNNNNKNTKHEIHQPQPKTIRAALFNASLFSRAVSNGGVGSATISFESQLNSQNLRKENALKHNQSFESSRNNMSETKFKEDVVVMMTQQQQQQQEGETITKKQLDDDGQTTTTTKVSCNGASCGSGVSGGDNASSGTDKHDGRGGKEKPCFNSSLADILHFMELVGNLKHTKRTGWVLRDVDDCESISGHMYRMSMMTFLLEETEGLNRIRCMELALVHDLAESLVGDLTPFCGVAKEDKKAMELKAMADICKLVEPRGKRIMELFEEYEEGQSAESKFVKDLDRLDMVMQAFEYEKRDNCLMKHQEFFDSTEGKFQHPFIKKLVKEICDQRKSLVEANVIAKGELNLKTVTPNCPPCLEHKMEHKNERS